MTVSRVRHTCSKSEYRKQYEVRLTVIGEQMFPVAIHAGSDAARLDWRTDYASLTYEP